MIRKFLINDLEDIMKLWLETNLSAHNFIDKNYWTRNYYDVRKMMPEAEIYVYEEDKCIKGFIGFMDNYIAGIFVQSDSQSKGIGRALIDYSKKIKDKLMLNVYEKNRRAVNFYKREKFKVLEKNKDENTGEVEFSMIWIRDIN